MLLLVNKHILVYSFPHAQIMCIEYTIWIRIKLTSGIYIIFDLVIHAYTVHI